MKNYLLSNNYIVTRVTTLLLWQLEALIQHFKTMIIFFDFLISPLVEYGDLTSPSS